MNWTRRKAKFRYEGDLEEVTLRMPASDAYDLARLLCLAGASNGPKLQAFLEDTETGDLDLVRLRESDSIAAHPEIKRLVQDAAGKR